MNISQCLNLGWVSQVLWVAGGPWVACGLSEDFMQPAREQQTFIFKRKTLVFVDCMLPKIVIYSKQKQKEQRRKLSTFNIYFNFIKKIKIKPQLKDLNMQNPSCVRPRVN